VPHHRRIPPFRRLVAVVGGGRAVEGRVLAIFLVAVGGAWAAIALLDAVAAKETRAFDAWVLRQLRAEDDPGDIVDPAWVEQAWREITALGDTVVLVLVVAAVAGGFFIMRRAAAAWLLIAASSSGVAFYHGLKRLVDRARPPEAFHLAEVATPSFPSGHSMMAAVVYITLWILIARLEVRRSIRIYGLAIALLITVLVGLSRVSLGVHYPTDVLAGWFFGTVWAIVCWLAVCRLERRGGLAGDGADA